MLNWISDYCEFSCWNSCSSVSDMCEDMKLFIIVVLMMKLHVHNMRKWVYCEFYSNCWVVLCCCWFVVEFMFDWCCCCFEIMLLMIHNLGVHNHGFVKRIKLLLLVLWKWVDLVNHVEMTIVCMLNVFLKALLSSWTCKQPLGTNLGIGRSKLGILGEKGLEPESFSAELMKANNKRAVSEQPQRVSGTRSLKRTESER